MTKVEASNKLAELAREIGAAGLETEAAIVAYTAAIFAGGLAIPIESLYEFTKTTTSISLQLQQAELSARAVGVQSEWPEEIDTEK